MNALNNSAAPSRPSSVRLARWLWRVMWNRRTGWTLACLVSLLTLYYQWENRRSARELAAAHARLLERIGTDSALALAPPAIPDEQNYFALPVVQQWAAGPLAKGSRFKRYHIPKEAFLPPGFIPPRLIENTDGTSHLDFAAWGPGQDLKGQPPAVVMNRKLGDGNGLLPPLAAGLDRPFSCFKPGPRESLEAAGDNLYAAEIPSILHLHENLQSLGLHLRCAAAAGDAQKTRDVSLITLRLFPEAAASHHGPLVSALVSLAAHDLAFAALQDALGQPAWSEAALHELQMQLGKIQDIEVVERALEMEILAGFGASLRIREQARRGDLQLFDWNWGQPGQGWASRLSNFALASLVLYGPDGWHDANIAFYLECQLLILGPRGETAWLDGARRGQEVQQRRRLDDVSLMWSPRRVLATVALPNVGNLYAGAAETLFHRRCLIIACALEKHRLRHGAYPAHLDEVAGELKPFPVADPARPPQLPGYRLEQGGYVLWSAGPDAKDDAGTSGKDWLWRMRRGGD